MLRYRYRMSRDTVTGSLSVWQARVTCNLYSTRNFSCITSLVIGFAYTYVCIFVYRYTIYIMYVYSDSMLMGRLMRNQNPQLQFQFLEQVDVSSHKCTLFILFICKCLTYWPDFYVFVCFFCSFNFFGPQLPDKAYL